MIVLVTPVPVRFLIVFVQMAEFDVWVVMSFYCPLVVINDLVVVPAMAVVIVGIVVVAAMFGTAAYSGQRQSQGAGDQKCSYEFFLKLHVSLRVGHFSANVLVA